MTHDAIAMKCEHLDELEHFHHELEMVLDWDADFVKKNDDPTFGLIVRRMAAVEGGVVSLRPFVRWGR